MADSTEPDPSATHRANPADRPVYVIGGGPGGLAAAYALRARGYVPSCWRGPTASARPGGATTTGCTCTPPGGCPPCPGLPIPRRFGRWVARDDVVRYLEKYAEHHELEIVTGVEVTRVERAPDGTGWLLHATGGRELTGARGRGRHRLQPHPAPARLAGPGHYTGELLHASAYRNAAPYAGRDVLVVGVGNTGAEIAVDLVEGGAARVRLAVRTAPHIVRRSTAGWPAQATGILVRRLPVAAGRPDRRRAWRGSSVPDLSAYGLPRPGHRPVLPGAARARSRCRTSA